MMQSRSLQTVTALAVLTLATSAGLLLVSPQPKATMLLAVLVLGALLVIALEYPLAIYAILVALLGLFSESPTDELIPGNDLVWSNLFAGITPAELLLILLVVVAVVDHVNKKESGALLWPGSPALAAALLAAVAVSSAIAFGHSREGLYAAQPTITLFLALVTGYWLARHHGQQQLLYWLVAASGLLLVQGLYNGLVLNKLSFYDASPVFLLGICAILVAFRAVDIGSWRFPYLLLATLVIVLSLRRAIWLDIVIALAITGVWSGRSGFRNALALLAAAIVVLELISPGIAFSQIEHAVKYTTGAEGREFSTDYRRWETANAWSNIERHPLVGIGPATDWTLYDSFNGRFRPYGFSYLHNSYLWVWLRFSVLGLAAYVLFFALSAWRLLGGRRSPLEAVAAGGMMIGLSIAVYTASFLTTTARWPLTVGLLLGIGLAARVRQRESRGIEEAAAPAKF